MNGGQAGHLKVFNRLGRHVSAAPRVPRLAELLAMTPEELSRQDIAAMNLACAEGLPGSEGVDMAGCLVTLEHWTRVVERYERDCRRDFYADPRPCQNERGFASFLAMVTILKRGLKIDYQPTAIGNFKFLDSRDDLIHGLLTRRLGTCASLPVLFVSIGRRLGWPLYLALSNGHVLCQWVYPDGRRINLEGSCAGGASIQTDEECARWPRPITPDELASGRYLRPLSRVEEFGLFLATRSWCLDDNGRPAEAVYARRHVRRLAPKVLHRPRPFDLQGVPVLEGPPIASPPLPRKWQPVSVRPVGTPLRSLDGVVIPSQFYSETCW